MLALCLRTSAVLFVFSLLIAPIGAQNPDVQFHLVGPATVSGSETFPVSANFDNLTTSAVSGWSLGVCHDSTVFTLEGVSAGSTTSGFMSGTGPDFMDLTIHAGAGFTQGVVICFMACETIPAGTANAELATGNYTAIQTPVEPDPVVASQIAFCSSLGSPPIACVATIAGASVAPTLNALDVQIEPEPLINPNYVLAFEAPALVQTSEAFSTRVLFDNNGNDVAGWSYGVCFNPQELQLDSIHSGTAPLTLKQGQQVDFVENQQHPNGATFGVVICFTMCATLPAGTQDAELNVLDFTALSDPDPAGPPVASVLEFCDTLGVPPIRTVVTVNGASVFPTTHPSTIEIEGVPPTNLEYSIDPIPSRYFVPSNPVDTPFTATVRIEQTGTDAPLMTQGFSMGLAHDPAMLQAVAVNPAEALTALPNGIADFFVTMIQPNGWTAAVVYATDMVQTIAFSPSQAVLSIDYTTVAPGFAGVNEPQAIPLTWTNTLGSPPVENVIVIADGTGNFPNLIDAVVPMEPQFSGGFMRGDANGDGVVQITDAVFILADLFQGGPTTRNICFAANDVNSDSMIHLADPVFLLNFIFAAGPAPSAPYPECGLTTIADCQLPGFCAP